ncbi:MAG: hypothetical protein ACJAUC_004684, partial [Planctomycetota bacterium]
MSVRCPIPKTCIAVAGIAKAVLGLILITAMCNTAQAQWSGSAWAELTVPQGVTNAAVNGQGKLV